ncbi:MAG TPA: HD domain-containing protein [Rhodospirillales bacterium]|nr:HD domain-containing protein [Rhodospirillales bacterium]
MIAFAGGETSVQAQLEGVHDQLRAELPGIVRIGVAVYDQRTDILQTFIHSTRGRAPFSLYEAKLSDVPSLAVLARDRCERIVDDLGTLAAKAEAQGGAASPHTRQLIEHRYRSSYTKPFYDHGELFGFLFYDSDRRGYFSEGVIRHLTIYTHLISLLIIRGVSSARVVRSAVDVARQWSHLRDEETGAHLDRMSRYARLVARRLAVQRKLNDEFIEFVFLFAPLHDIGKIAVPDRILLKPGRLTADEFEIMKSHVAKGVEMVDTMAKQFSFSSAAHMDVMHNIVRYHHESVDGSGYLAGLKGEAIPLEARIVTVADVFDALTTKRPYKEAWSDDDAFAFLGSLAGKKFDADCVAALAGARREVTAIKEHFGNGENAFGGFHEAYLEEV